MKRLLLALLILGSIGSVIGYGLFEARRFLAGPSIIIEEPQGGSVIANPLLVIEGVARNISFLTINDKPVLTDERGHFTNKLSPPPGATIVTVEGTDRFGRGTSADVRITMINFCPIA
ncbi:MAG: hypothetical protein Q8P58_01010 [Candidatus Adlerbacteria bacterium]|nr:hypothetical protein [Candidatus Adlerbacteria bacterium]MDZ4226467.1 hypothetical protein [Patescibacteria group bacterium]